ncbi:unnamed protein product [Phytophthora fragariaefolia]|uniref:Unnamed protein product n=1 Tax=Phytophthora fragariaefolia TaxID=1490495 RepID=A0A9W6U638_9STRA|nr:unnamed protein product [Phytophthora fragariaefolia]
MQSPPLHDNSAPTPSLAAATTPYRAGAGRLHQENTQPCDAGARHSEADSDASLRGDQACSKNNVSGSERESNSSDARDDSGDGDFSLESSAGESDEEALTEASAPSIGEFKEDLSNYLFDVNFNAQVTKLIQSDLCESGYVRGKTKELESLLCSLSQMTKAEKTTSLYTLLAVLMQVPVDHKRGNGNRDRLNFYFPFVGEVCRPVFATAEFWTMAHVIEAVNAAASNAMAAHVPRGSEPFKSYNQCWWSCTSGSMVCGNTRSFLSIALSRVWWLAKRADVLMQRSRIYDASLMVF